MPEVSYEMLPPLCDDVPASGEGERDAVEANQWAEMGTVHQPAA